MPGEHPDGIAERAGAAQLRLAAVARHAVAAWLPFQQQGRTRRIDDLILLAGAAVHDLYGHVIRGQLPERDARPDRQRRAGALIAVVRPDVVDPYRGPGFRHPLLP